MNGISSGKKLLFALIFATVFVSPAAAEWDVTVPNHVPTDGDSIFTSEGNQTIVFVEIRTEQFDEPVTESGTTDASEFLYRYNESEGQLQNLSYYQNGFWYAKFNADLSKHGMANDNAKIRFDVKGDRQPNDDVGSGGWKNTTLSLKAGMHNVDVVQGLPSTVVPGQTVNITANVTNRTTGEPVNMTNVYTYFRNATWTQNGNYDLSYNQSTELFKGEVTIPQGYDSKYLMRVESKNRSNDAPENSQGLYSEFVDTAKEFKGHVQDLANIQGCTTSLGDETPNAAECEPGAMLDTVYNVTGPEPDSVTVSAYKRNSSSNELEQYSETSMSEVEEGLYSSDISIPDLNTSAYDKEITLNFNATRNGRSHVDVKTLGYSALEVINVASRNTVQGESYDLSLQTVKPKSLSPWTDSRIESMEVNVSDTDGDLFGSYNLSNFTYNSQESAFEQEIMIPEQADIGRWNLQIRASDIYGEVKSKSSGFGVSSSEQTFNINDTTFEKEEEGVEEFNLTVQNLVGSEITLDTNVSEGLDDQINLSDQVTISDDRENITVTVNLTEFESVEGHVNFTDTDTGYNRSVGLSINTRSCKFSAGDVCSISGKWINITADSRDDYTREVVVQNNASDGNATNLTTVVNGDISDIVEVEDLYTVENELAIQINYSVEEAGNYTGSVEFEPDNSSSALIYNTSLETTFEQDDEKGLVTVSNIDLGTIPSGSNLTQELEIQNNGNIEIQNLEAVSSDFNVGLNVSDLNISEGVTESVGLEFQDITSEDGQVELSGNTSEGGVSSMISVNATTVENYSARASELQDRIDELKPVRGSNLTQTLTEVSNSIEDIEQNWSEGNYMIARALFQEGDRRLEYVSNQDTTGGSDDGGDDGDTGGSDDPGSESGESDEDDTDTGGGDQSDPDGSQQSNDGGGLPIIPIVAVLAVLGIIGFVVYESYIPEEGDPLYGVLGDGE